MAETIGFARHDHASCIANTVAAADEKCRSEGLQLTPVRRRVLEMLLDRHRALGAYEILDLLRNEGLGSQPPVAYRALDFLVRNGFAHRIEGQNAFIACTCPGESHTPVFLICRMCNAVAEARAEASADLLGEVAADTGFQIEKTVIEAVGVCPGCATEASA